MTTTETHTSPTVVEINRGDESSSELAPYERQVDKTLSFSEEEVVIKELNLYGIHDIINADISKIVIPACDLEIEFVPYKF